MIDFERLEELNDFTDALFGYNKDSALAPTGPRLDLSRPNFHDSKRDFLREKTTVEQAIMHGEGFLNLFVGQEYKGDSEHADMRNRITTAVNQFAKGNARRKHLKSADDLVLKNILETGFFYNSLFVMFEILSVYRQRLAELNDQEKQFWNVTNRPPNYYARTIALRFARMYAREKRERPTFGISSQGNHPSTDFGRALEKIFQLVEVKASVRNAGVWAINQLTDDDLKPPQRGLMGGLFGLDHKASSATQPTENALLKLQRSLEKGSD